jgi:hypothetical protein
MAELSWSLLLVFVPLCGRIGPDAPADVLTAIVVGLMSSLSLLHFIPLMGRVSTPSLFKCLQVSVALLVAVMVFMSNTFPYTATHPKVRVYISKK